MNIAVIPARGGSKRIPRKNIKTFAGKPMISHSIKAAIDSRLFQHIVVSTDDLEIASISRAFGASVPFIRHPSLADDHTATVSVIADVANRCGSLGWRPEFICCIYPCAPLLSTDDLSNALEALKKSEASYSMPVTEYQSAIQRALQLTDQGMVVAMHPQHEASRTQDLPKAFHDAGQFYWGRFDSWKRQQRIYESSTAIVIPHWRAVDIDTIDDWQRAELFFEVAKSFTGCSRS
jgi:pseudaminic acid cytidylyltransferase